MRYIIIDLEATCWQDVRDFDRMETIEIGAVELPSAAAPHDREFNQFIQPVAEPQLSEFCRDLTSIQQQDVNSANHFWGVFQDFLKWIGEAPFVICSWGRYDMTQLQTDCRRHGMAFPASFEAHVNLKQEYARVFRTKVSGMARALEHAGLPLDGRHHRGIDDARNIAKLANLVLPALESAEQTPTPRVD